MVIKPKIRGFICTTAHPLGCEQAVKEQIAYVKNKKITFGPKNVLIIGASTGYGLASRIVASFSGTSSGKLSAANTIGVFYEKEASDDRTATAGFYNTVAFEKFAQQEGIYAKSINGDAFSDAIKQQTVDLIRKDLGQIDLVIYSLASPRRQHPKTGEVFNSTLKPIGQTFTSKTVDPMRGEVKEITIEPASNEDIANTVAVMGGEDWEMWIDKLTQENLLAPEAMTIAYDYIGPKLTYPIYKDGTIGRAKQHLYESAQKIAKKLMPIKGKAFLSVNKALVTQASAAIPVVPLYVSLLYKLMKEKGTHENCIEQIARLFHEKVYVADGPVLDASGRVRLDDREMEEDIQAKVATLWADITTENLESLTDIQGYRDEFYKLFGFNFSQIDYDADVNPNLAIPSNAEK